MKAVRGYRGAGNQRPWEPVGLDLLLLGRWKERLATGTQVPQALGRDHNDL